MALIPRCPHKAGPGAAHEQRPAGFERRLNRATVAAIAAIALALCAQTDTTNAAASHPPTPPSPKATASESPAGTLPVTIAINREAPGHPIPKRFLGLSFEVAAIKTLAHDGRRGNLVELLRSLGPGMLRFGGVTADEHVAWTDAETPRPEWARSTIGPSDMTALGVLARRSGWQVLLTVGLAHYEPQTAAREVAAAHRALGPSLAAVEIGNEPNAYGNHGFRELPWIAQGYEEQVSDYREAIGALTPNVPIAGPDVSGSGIFPEWGSEEALAQAPALLTGHHYPLGCAQTPPPSIEALLSSATRGLAARSLATYLQVANTNKVPLRIDETNTVSCGGVAGISNTFASALWATGYITQGMTAGTVGVNFQGNPTNCAGYTPICAPDPAALAKGWFRAQPEWYALLLTRSLVGERPLPITISSEGVEDTEGTEGAPDLVAAAFAGPKRSLKVVVSNNDPDNTSPLAIDLEVGPHMGQAHILRLTAPSESATDDVLLAGRSVASNGAWHTSKHTETIAPHSGFVTVQLTPGSAALVSVSQPPPKRPHHKRKHKRK